MPKRSNSKTEPWERQNGESEKAYEAFAIYRDMGDKRSVSAVSERLTKSRQLISRWKSNWYWEDRCLAYDNHLQKEAYDQAVKSVRKMTDRHIKIALKLQEKALLALENMNADDINPKDLIAFIREATKLERDNRNELVRITNIGQEDDESGDTDVVFYLPDNGRDGNGGE